MRFRPDDPSHPQILQVQRAVNGHESGPPRHFHPKVVSEVPGHANISITPDRYSHAVPALEEEAAARVTTLIFGSLRSMNPVESIIDWVGSNLLLVVGMGLVVVVAAPPIWPTLFDSEYRKGTKTIDSTRLAQRRQVGWAIAVVGALEFAFILAANPEVRCSLLGGNWHGGFTGCLH
jgi:hypothetical protein